MSDIPREQKPSRQEVADEVTYTAFPEPQEGDLIWLPIE